jgi:hypothetical protein
MIKVDLIELKSDGKVEVLHHTLIVYDPVF